MRTALDSDPRFSFSLVYRLGSILPFESLSSVNGGGIPQRVKLFNTFDPQNTTYPPIKYKVSRSGSLIEFHHLLEYLDCPDLQEITVHREYDPAVNAIVSFVLSWRQDYRDEFAKFAPQYKPFMDAVTEFINYEDGAYVYAIEFEDMIIPYCKCAFKLIKSVVATTPPKPSICDFDNEPFQLMRYVDPKFVNHLHEVYKHLTDETFTPDDIAKLEEPMRPPYDLETRIGNYDQLRESARVKFITGQACAGKTTLLSYLNKVGNWQIMSRGKIGGFSGKADNPVAVAMLHAAVNFTLGHSNVLGVSIHPDDKTNTEKNQLFALFCYRTVQTSTIRCGSGSWSCATPNTPPTSYGSCCDF